MSRILKKKQPIITQPYQKGKHNALDLVAEGYTTDLVTAHSDGVVIWIQTGQKNNIHTSGDATYGNAVKLKHSNGYCTLYAHLADVRVSLNQKVKQGDILGMMGNTGRAYGMHLHFEVRQNESYRSIIDPTPYINQGLPRMDENTRIRTWQEMMNHVYGSNLSLDNSYGPDSKSKANLYQLYYKLPTIKNDHVAWLQKRLNELGYHLDVDHSFGPKTRDAVIDFQRKCKIKDNGYVGKDTTLFLLK